MEAFVFDISLPTNWSQLTDRQLTFLFAQLGKNRPAYDVETRCLLKWAQLVILDQLPNGSFLVRRRSHHPRIPFRKKLPTVVLSASQLFATTRTLAWIEQVPSNPIRISRIGYHRALPTDFMEVPFEKYLYCDNLYQGYLQTKSEGVLTELAQILYDSEHLRPNTTQWISVFYWFASLKSFFARKFHHFLQPVSNESANLLESTPIQQRVEESMNSQIRALTKGDITKEKQILKKVAIKFGDSKSFLYLVGRYLLFNLLNMRNIVESDSNVILLSPGLFPEIVEEIKEKCGKHGIRVAFCGSKDNIWVRDYMPIQLSDDCFLEYQYTPDYLLSSKRYSKYLVTSEHFVEDTLEKTTKQLGLVIDGGNVVKLADKYVAMTEKVMVENPRYSQTDIESIIRDCFHREVLWLPWDKAEIYGHSDGIVNYLNGTVVMTNYSDFDKNIARQVHERLIKAGYEVKQLEYSFKRGFHRRSWCYVNFVETQNVVLVPRLGVEEDSEAVEQLSKITPKPIETINALSLVRRGGAIHCATWNIYQ